MSVVDAVAFVVTVVAGAVRVGVGDVARRR